MGQHDPGGRLRVIQLHGRQAAGRRSQTTSDPCWKANWRNLCWSVHFGPGRSTFWRVEIEKRQVSAMSSFAGSTEGEPKNIAKPVAEYNGIVRCVCLNIRIAVFNHPSLPPSSAQNSADSHCRIAGPFSSQHQHADLQES